MHRNRIRTNSPEGWDWLSVPVLSKGRFNQQILEAQVDPSTPWARKHWRAIDGTTEGASLQDLRGRAPGALRAPVTSFCDLTCAFLELLLRLLGISGSSSAPRRWASRGSPRASCSRCARPTGADTYLSGVHGRDYLDVAEFERQGVRLLFQDFSARSTPSAGPALHPESFRDRPPVQLWTRQLEGAHP
jgi:hypothetical protein